MGYESKAAEFHQAAVRFIEKHEKKVVKIQMGHGSSDSNYLYRPGLFMIDGMGAVGHGIHSPSETVEVNSLFTRSAAVVDLIQWVAKSSV